MRLIILAASLLFIVTCSSKQQDNGKVLKNDIVKISTPHGDIFIMLFPETPRHKASFIKLVNEGYFNNYSFNRVIADFVIQGGCPDTPEGFSNSPYLLEPEFNNELTHVYGAVGAGRDDNPEMLSAGCQFYIVQNKEGLHRLDNKYTVFGHVVKGMDVVDTIVTLETDSIDEPLISVPLKVEYYSLDSLALQELLF
jgi:peptidyl-prolyl cis-trans isomerase B (cyclophilin B)